jgi:CheY-like chemotaxis protein
MNCLLIDDDLDDQEIFLLCLNEVRPDVECAVANNGVDALQMLNDKESYSPDVIFLDVNMPKMSGMECLTQLRAIPRLKKSCIFIYSTTSEYSAVQRAKELGASEYVMKPTETDQLKKTLDRIFTCCQPDIS